MKSFLLLLLLSNFIIASNSASILEQLQDGVNQLQRFKQKVGELRRNEDKLELKNVELESNLDSSAQGMNLNCQHVERCKNVVKAAGVTVENIPYTKLYPRYVLAYYRMPNYNPLMDNWCAET